MSAATAVKLVLRPYQERIGAKVQASFAKLLGKTKEPPAVMIESPTGSGKTVMGFDTINRIRQLVAQTRKKNIEDIRISWCAMRSNLLAQAERENQSKFGIDGIQYVSMFAKEIPKTDILVFDECQHSCANSAVDVYVKSESAVVLGLSATPYRTDRQRLCFHNSVRDAGYRQLIHEGWLSPFNQFMIPDWSVDMVTRTYLREPSRWGKSIAYFLTIEECNRACDIVRAAGMRADVVTGDSPREEQLAAFERGELDILFNVFVLAEGFDCPELRTVFCRPSGKGPTTQMCGRAFRKLPSKIANIVQSQDTRMPFVRVATPEQQYVLSNDRTSWRTIARNDEVDKTIEVMRKAIVQTDVDIPDIIRNSWKKRNRRRNPDGFVPDNTADM